MEEVSSPRRESEEDEERSYRRSKEYIDGFDVHNTYLEAVVLDERNETRNSKTQ